MKQNHAAYTPEDYEVWKTLFNRQLTLLNEKASGYFLNALDSIGFCPEQIPDFDEVNKKLQKSTGWQLVAVPNIVPEREFFDLLAQKKFPATTWLRKKSQLDYLEEPDMFHDVFGHVPLLSNSAYVNFFQQLANIALKHIDEPEIITMLGRIYWFTIEFGLIKENNEIKIYGAGLLSSFGESIHCLSREVNHFGFDVKTVMNKSFINSEMQNDYFVIPSFEHLFGQLNKIEELIEEITFVK